MFFFKSIVPVKRSTFTYRSWHTFLKAYVISDIWKHFGCVLRGVRVLLAYYTWFSATSETSSYQHKNNVFAIDQWAPSRVTICHACHFLAEQKANSTTLPRTTNLPDVSFCESRPHLIDFLRPMPEVPADWGKCGHVSFQKGRGPMSATQVHWSTRKSVELASANFSDQTFWNFS